MTSSIRISCEVPLPPPEAFDTVMEKLRSALARFQIQFDPGPAGRFLEREFAAGEVVVWEPPRRVAMRWRQASWAPDSAAHIELTVEPSDAGSMMTLEHRGLESLFEDPGEQTGWFAGEVLARYLHAVAPDAFGTWVTDRYARRPSGAQARAMYADPLYHYPNFRVILSELALSRGDFLVEVGCGGGALLKAALESGCRAAGVDHSSEMLRVARQVNAAAVAEGRLHLVESDASALPFRDATFTAAAMTGVLGFLRDPIAAFAGIRRVLRRGGRFICLGSDPEWRGTPAAPEPMASRLRFYDSDELERLARAAGFDDIRVLRRDLEPFAREAGVPEEHLPLFKARPDGGERFLMCRV